MLLSLKVPVAMNCCVEPTDSVGVAGVTVIDTNPVGVRVQADTTPPQTVLYYCQ